MLLRVDIVVKMMGNIFYFLGLFSLSSVLVDAESL